MAIGDTWPILLLIIIVLAALLFGQIRQRTALRDWLAAPNQKEIPDGIGPWYEIFSRLRRLRKEDHSAYSALSDTLDRFRLAVQALPDGVILLDGTEHLEWANTAACRHFALDASRDIGTQIGHLIRQGKFHKLLESREQTDRSEPLLLSMGRQGSELVLAILLIPFANSGTLLLSRDVTDLARTDAIRRDFVANVSHELRTPLTVISGFVEQFLSETPPRGDAAAGFLRLMADQSARMNRLVEDLLTLSQLENDMRPAVDEVISMKEMLDDLQSEARALAEGRQTIRIGDASAGDLRGSSHELRCAFGNLVSNAVRYTPVGGTVTLNWRIDDGCPTFSVTDTGIGIPAEHIPRLTERFYRVDKGRSSATGGTGLGLAIVKHVLTRHQSALTIQSVISRGSTFSVKLPTDRMAS